MSGPADLWGLPLCKSWMSCFDHQWGLWCSPSRSNFTLSRITAHSTRTVSYRLITLCHIHPDRLFLIPLRMFGQPWTKISLKIIPFTCNHYITVTQGIMARERLWSVDGRLNLLELSSIIIITMEFLFQTEVTWIMHSIMWAGIPISGQAHSIFSTIFIIISYCWVRKSKDFLEG